MAKVVKGIWPGNPSGATRAARQPCQYEAFVPDRLTDLHFDLPMQMATDLAEVEVAVRRLNQSSALMANLEPLARFLLRAEAVASSNIEGLRMNVRRLARSEAEMREGWARSDEVAAAVLEISALLTKPSLCPAIPPRRSLWKQFDQSTLLSWLVLGMNHGRAWCAMSKTGSEASVRAWRCSSHRHQPKSRPCSRTTTLFLDSYEQPAILQAALAHSQFETIHPFADGNGRTGRAIIQLVVRRRGLATSVVPPVSLVLATETRQYVDALMKTRVVGEEASVQIAWAQVFIEATARACRDSLSFSRALAELESVNRAKLGRVRAGSAVDLLVNAFLPCRSSRSRPHRNSSAEVMLRWVMLL